jgi:hypothetical protein
VFPCRRILGSWINAETKQRIDVRPGSRRHGFFCSAKLAVDIFPLP